MPCLSAAIAGLRNLAAPFGSGLATAIATTLVATLAAPAAAAPNVVASIVPIHSLVAGVMAGVADPRLVMRGGGSPHTYQMRPSDAAALANADLVFWIGEGLETYLARPIANLGTHARVVAFEKLPGVARLPAREGGAWTGAHEHDSGHDGSGGRDGDDAHADGHLWLDPGNAALFVAAAAAALSDVDPENARTYAHNARSLAERIADADRAIERRLAPVRMRPYVVFHDAYQYFERRYRLNAVGAITVSPQRLPGARRIIELRERIATTGAACVFREPQFVPELVDTVIEGTPARAGVLDPLGAAIEPGVDAWFVLMEGMAAAMAACLGEG